jgi:hypothetical protein
MKIYINNFNIEILSEVMKNIFETYIRSETYILIYSEEGIYRIDNDKTIKKLICLDNNIKIFKKYYGEFTLVADPSYYTTEIAHNISPQHISKRVKRLFFEVNKNSNIQLVIEGEVIEESENLNDIYFEVSDTIDINDTLIKKEIIVFLSLLN